MKALIEPLQELSGYEDMTKAAMQPGLVTISGCIDAQKPHMIYALGRAKKKRLIVTFHEQKAKELYEDCRFFDKNTVYYPAKDILFYQSDLRGNQLTKERVNAIKVLLEEEEVSSLQADKLNVATAIRKSKNEKFDGFMILLFGERFYST